MNIEKLARERENRHLDGKLTSHEADRILHQIYAQVGYNMQPSYKILLAPPETPSGLSNPFYTLNKH